MPHRSRTKKASGSSREDRISALPDGVLQHVLGFLRADEAVQTSVLARRWRHLWKSMRRLRIISSDPEVREIAHGFNKLVNCLLLQREPGLALDEVELAGYSITDGDDTYTYFNIWIRHALLCQARVLTVDLHYEFTITLDDPPLVSRHLRRLKLTDIHLKGNISSLFS